MVKNDGRIAGTNTARRLNKRLLLQHQCISAHQARESRNGENGHGDNHVRNAAAQHGDHGYRQQNAGKGEQHIADTHNQPIPPTFVVSRQQTQHCANRRANKHGKDSCRQRDLGANQHAAKDISSQRIDTKPVQHRRPIIQTVIIEVIFGIKWRQPASKNRHHDQEQYKQPSEHRHVLSTKTTPELMPRCAYLLWLNKGHCIQNRLSAPVKKSHPYLYLIAGLMAA